VYLLYLCTYCTCVPIVPVYLLYLCTYCTCIPTVPVYVLYLCTYCTSVLLKKISVFFLHYLVMCIATLSTMKITNKMHYKYID
jgi:hypothetical protein